MKPRELPRLGNEGVVFAFEFTPHLTLAWSVIVHISYRSIHIQTGFRVIFTCSKTAGSEVYGDFPGGIHGLDVLQFGNIPCLETCEASRMKLSGARL